MKKKRRLLTVGILIICILITGDGAMRQVSGKATGRSSQEVDAWLSEYDNYSDAPSYQNYLQQNLMEDSSGTESSLDQEKDAYVIEAAEYSSIEGMEGKTYSGYEGSEGNSLFTEEQGMVEWKTEIAKSGYYNLIIEYFPCEGKSSDIQRTVLIDGQIPFSEAGITEYCRFWTNEKAELLTDNKGNDVRNRQIEAPRWSEKAVGDARGYYTEPFRFYLSEGVHTIGLVSVREPMVIRRIRIEKTETVPTYEELSLEYEQKQYKSPAASAEKEDGVITIQAEDASLKSTPMLYGISDRSSPALTPYDPAKVKINSIGGTNWNEAGEWLEWQVEVKESGLYKIALHNKQDTVRGVPVKRKLTIDGKTPFKEAEQFDFTYHGDWTVTSLGGDEPYLFYLEAGTHTLRLEAVLGSLSESVRRVEVSLKNLNQIYYDIMMITGTQPDAYRDYQIGKKIPELSARMAEESAQLKDVVNGLRQAGGSSGDREAVINTVIGQLDSFAADVERVVPRLDDFKKNIGAIGTWLLQINDIPLALDSIFIIPADGKVPKLNNSFFRKAWHEIQSIYYSFVIDYNSIGNVSDEKDQQTITVWIGTGRDQANALKALIDEEFTKTEGISVNLMLVQMDTLLQATLSGQGPDVAMQVAGNLPMNYAMRGAVADLTQFEGFEEVSSRFFDSAMTPYRFRDACYALPETQTFQMMFYRKDILKEQGIEVPETWDDIKAAISTLARSNMTFGMAPTPGQSFGMFLYQMGGEFYTEDGKASALDQDIAVGAFKEWVSYYTDYTLEREFDFANRFRTGEMPIGITDYSMYNTLQVSAPEIQGLWAFTKVPGTVREDGTINHTAPSGGQAAIILNNSDKQDAAWKFLKWWTSEEVQVKFGREMEGLMGAAARYPTANIKALERLPWSASDYNNLLEQMQWVKGIPEVPGGYFTERNINNAFYKVVVSQSIGPREALMDNVRFINDEIRYKRKEFGID